MAPQRTSNRLRTSPVSAATFFIKSIRVGFGRNFLTSVARFSSCERVVNVIGGFPVVVQVYMGRSGSSTR